MARHSALCSPAEHKVDSKEDAELRAQLQERDSTISDMRLQNSEMKEFFREKVDAEHFELLIEWDELPPSFQTDIDFAKSITRGLHVRNVKQIFETIPALRHGGDYWKRIVSNLDYNLAGILCDYAPVAILSDFDLMLAACQRKKDVIYHLGELPAGPAANRQFVHTLLQRYPTLLTYLAEDTVHLFPDLVAQTFDSFSQQLCSTQSYSAVRWARSRKILIWRFLRSPNLPM